MLKLKSLIILCLVSGLMLANAIPVNALGLRVQVPEKYNSVIAGERLYFETEIKYPENPSRKDLRITYQIVGSEGLVTESKVLKAVETQASFLDFIVIPENVRHGNYSIVVIVEDYEDLHEEVSSDFSVVTSEVDQLRMYLTLILIAVGVVGLLTIVNLVILRRNISNS